MGSTSLFVKPRKMLSCGVNQGTDAPGVLLNGLLPFLETDFANIADQHRLSFLPN